jgi:CRP-like cAMP-binding protein
MVSPELLRRYSIFGGLSMGQIVALAQIANERRYGPDQLLLEETEPIQDLMLIISGSVAVQFELTSANHEVVVGTVGAGEIVDWMAIVPPYTASAAVRTQSDCHLLMIDARQLRNWIEEDSQLGRILLERSARNLCERLRDLRIESLAYALG